MTEKTCGLENPNRCQHAANGGLYWYCKYIGCCIHQLPQDSCINYNQLGGPYLNPQQPKQESK